MIYACALALAAGGLLVALFPNFDLTYISPLALVPLLVAVEREPRPRRRFLLGCLTGWVFWAGTCYWVYGVLHRHGHLPAVGAATLYTSFFLIKGLHVGVFAWLVGPALSRWWGIPAVAAIWTAIEGTHPYAGFTWLMLGNAATNMAVVARLAPITGIAGISFVLAMMNAAVALTLFRRPKKHLAWLLAVPLLYLLPKLPAPLAGSRAAVLVQPNISEQEVWSSLWTGARAEKLLEQFAALSWPDRADALRPDLIIWPENPAPLYYYDDLRFRSFAEGVARQHNTHLLFGTTAFRDAEKRQPLNSAILLGPEGSEVARYDKIFLVPFGEFVPWPLHLLVEKITREAGDFVSGKQFVVARAGEGSIGTFICYESAMGRGVRRFAAAGARLLVTISNDGWFGRSAAREQHLLIARMRAVENGRWLLRASNTGITAVIDPAGRITAALPPDSAGALSASFDYADQETLYTRWGDWFWWSTVAIAAGLKILERQGL